MARRTRLFAAVAVATLAAAAVAGAAGAYWSSSGAGAGGATTGNLSFSVDALDVVDPTVELSPGTYGDLVVKLTNSSEVPLSLVALTTGAAQSSDPGCPATVVAADTDRTTNAAVAAFIDGLAPLAPSETRVVTFPGVVYMDPAAPNACQDAVFTFAVDAEAET